MMYQQFWTANALMMWWFTKFAGYEIVRSKWIPRHGSFGTIRYSTEWALAKRNGPKPR